MARIKPIWKLKLKDLLFEPLRYNGLSTGLVELPVTGSIKIGFRRYPVPETMEQFGGSICFGQRIYFTRKEEVDIGIILRLIAGYYFTIVSKKDWDEDRAISFGGTVLHSLAMECYPVAMHFVELTEQLVKRENKALYREPKKQEKAAGIDKLNKFSDLNAIMFLQDSFKCSENDVLLKPYNECLVRFMLQKEQNAYNERLTEIYRKESESKTKGK